MKPLHNSFAIAFFCLLTTSAGYAYEDGKQIPVQQAPVTVSQDEWRFYFTSYVWLPSADVDISLPEVNLPGRTIGGEISIDERWWDVLSKFSSDFYVLSLSGRFEAWKGRWGGFVDGYWIFGKRPSAVAIPGWSWTTQSQLARPRVTSHVATGQVNFWGCPDLTDSG